VIAHRRVQHQHVCAVFDHFSRGGLFCMALEHLGMGSLEQVVEASAGQRMSQAQATTMAFHVLRALTKMHEMDVIHRDIQPRHIMQSSQDGGHFKLTGFGLAAINASAQGEVSDTLLASTANGLVASAGSPHWMSPEQW
jgi:serine/threonine protein kinase